MNIIWIGSPNFDSARKPIDRVVLHWIVGSLASADAQFQKTTPGTSAQYGIEDNVIHQYVKEDKVAYHAGVYAINQRSIGIEHSAAPDRPASEETYRTSGALLGDICRRYNIPLDREHIIKHSEVKATSCPGTLDIDRIISLAKEGQMTDDEMVIKKTEYKDLYEGKQLYQQFKDAGYPSVADVKAEVDSWKKTLDEKKTDLKAAQDRADGFERSFKELKGACALALDTNQEVDQINAALSKLGKELDDFATLQTAFAALQSKHNSMTSTQTATIQAYEALLRNAYNPTELAKIPAPRRAEIVGKLLVSLIKDIKISLPKIRG